LPLIRKVLIDVQKSDLSLAKCFAAVEGNVSGCSGQQCFLIDDGVLMCRWVPQGGMADDDLTRGCDDVYQVVVPVAPVRARVSP